MLGSPLRYPGGKAKLFAYFAAMIDHNKLFDCTYCEPYAGGAGLALRLLSTGFVQRVALNDIDPAIYAFWQAALYRTDDMCALIESVPTTIDEWRLQKAVWQAQDTADELSLGFATFFLNRTNRSGIIEGAGPIGGYSQDGPWRMDVRFNRAQLSMQLRQLAAFRGQISLSRLDALDFTRARFAEPGSFCYLDPPYYVKGNKLYRNSYEHADHLSIRDLLLSNRRARWVASYDDVPAIRTLYSALAPITYSLSYTAGSKGTGREVIYFSDVIEHPRFDGFEQAAA